MKLGSDISAVVTGGASGLGAATVAALADAGVKVGIFDLNGEAGEALARQVGGCFCHCDVVDEASIDRALETARAAHGQERILVNCAGIARGEKTARRNRETGAVTPHDLDPFRQTIAVNLVGTFHMIAKSAAGMMTIDPVTDDGGRGVIVNTSSVAATDGQIGQVAYAASKGGVLSMTLPIARDLSRDGIRVMAIQPGLFETPMLAGLPDEVRTSLEDSVPFPSRLGMPAEYAALVRHICENEMLNGEHIRLDGAIRMAPK
ncbi:MAG: SDR family NAD(P)-dependent oxidoreductase [Methyloligellaceae bacterium]